MLTGFFLWTHLSSFFSCVCDKIKDRHFKLLTLLNSYSMYVCMLQKKTILFSYFITPNKSFMEAWMHYSEFYLPRYYQLLKVFFPFTVLKAWKNIIWIHPYCIQHSRVEDEKSGYNDSYYYVWMCFRKWWWFFEEGIRGLNNV